MYENDYGLNQMEMGAAPGAETPDDAPPEVFAPDPDSVVEPEENKTGEGDESDGQEESARQETPPEKPKRSRRKKEEQELQKPADDSETVEGADGGQSDEEDGESPEDDAGDGEESDVSKPPDGQARNVRRRRAESVLDEYGRAGIARPSAAKDGLAVLSAAAIRHLILTGAVDGIENDGNAHPRVVLFFGNVKVLIPFSEMGFDLSPDEADAREIGRNMDAVLGAKIDFMVRRVDTANRIAAASRKDAMMLRQRTILNARAGDDYRIREGMKCTARVVQVSRLSMQVELYGFQTRIRRDAVSSIWVRDIRESVRVGEERPVRIIRLERDEDSGEVIRMELSMKEAEESVETDLRAGNSYTGTVSGLTETAYFVKVVGVPVEMRCPVHANSVLETMDIGDTVKVVMRGLSDRGSHIGSIRKIIKKAEKSFF